MQRKNWLILIIILFAFGCNNQEQRKNSLEVLDNTIQDIADSSSTIANEGALQKNKGVFNSDITTSKAAQINTIDSTKKLVRTAQIKSKVQNVLNATINIEDATIKHGGFVTKSNLQSNISKTETTAISSDSLIETIFFTTYNNLICRVPNKTLDTLLKDIGKQLEFIDYRDINAQDVTLDIVKNNLIEKRTNNYVNTMNKVADNNTTKPLAVNEIANGILQTQEQQDQALIDKLKQQDEINYSPITLEIYQSESVQQRKIANPNSKLYQASFWFTLYNNLKIGGNCIIQFILLLVKVWPLFIIIFVGSLLYKKFRKKSQATNLNR